MLDADNAAFINGVITVIRWAVYLGVAAVLLWVSYLLLCLVGPATWQALKWIWDALLWPLVDSITYPVRRPLELSWQWYRKRHPKRTAADRMRDLGY